jgi:hypothetical protein
MFACGMTTERAAYCWSFWDAAGAQPRKVAGQKQ